MLHWFANLDQLLIWTIFVRIVLPVISKLLERQICTHSMLYLHSFNFIVLTQSGFQPHHLTESLMIKMTYDWLEAMDQGLYTGAIFLDLHKAFDFGNHDLLVTTLQYFFFLHGCFSSALLWLKSYLSDHQQCVNIEGSLSDT